jgi:hypothetical protein
MARIWRWLASKERHSRQYRPEEKRTAILLFTPGIELSAFPEIFASANGSANVAISEPGWDPSTKRHIALDRFQFIGIKG